LNELKKAPSPIDQHVAAAVAQNPRPAVTPGHRLEKDVEERWERPDEPTRLERIIASQFRRGIAVPLTPKEQQDQARMSLEQRCAFVAKIVVWTARAVERNIKETEP
jgi:hypothetical protein